MTMSKLVTMLLLVTNCIAFTPSAYTVNRRGQLNMRLINRRQGSMLKKKCKSVFGDKLRLQRSRMSATPVSENINEPSPVSPLVFHSMCFFPLAAAWRMVSKNFPREFTLAGVMFSCLLSMKFVDAQADDGLRLFKGANIIMPIIMMSALFLPIADDFSMTFMAGLTLDSLVGGKLDCPQFQIASVVIFGAYFYKFFSGNFTFQLIDMLAIAGAGAVEELLHEKFKILKQAGGNINQFVEFFNDSRMFSVVTVVPLFLWRGYHMAAPMMMAQWYGYEIGSYVTSRMLDKQNATDSA